MDSTTDALTRTLFSIMKQLAEKPCLYIVSPTIAKSDIVIPDSILKRVYADLPDRRMKTQG